MAVVKYLCISSVFLCSVNICGQQHEEHLEDSEDINPPR